MSQPGFSAAMLHPRNWPMWVGLGLLWLVIQLPYPTILAIGRWLGRGMYHLMPERRHIAETNLQLCFPEWSSDRRQQILRENFESNGIALFEMGMAWWWPPKRLARLAHIEGLEHLQQAAATGRGIDVDALHHAGNWRCLARAESNHRRHVP